MLESLLSSAIAVGLVILAAVVYIKLEDRRLERDRRAAFRAFWASYRQRWLDEHGVDLDAEPAEQIRQAREHRAHGSGTL